MKAIKNLCALCAICMALVACEKPILDTEDSNEPLGNVTLTFSAHGATTRAAATDIGNCFSKLNVMLFNADGTKYFDKVRTQYSTDENFGQLSLTLPAGEYGVVAVGHSSAKSATIKSMEMVQFTATDGQKLTDTFCYGGTVTVGEAPEQHQLTMNRMGAMVRFQFTDEEIPAQLTHVKFDYTGGSANFNPTTSEGTTKSTQSETRPVAADDVYEIYTFPYLSSSGTLKVTVTALTAQGDVIKKRTLEQVPVTRNRITSYTGPLFSEGEGTITQSGFGFTVNGEWSGEDNYDF
jgi:hypothetical protein